MELTHFYRGGGLFWQSLEVFIFSENETSGASIHGIWYPASKRIVNLPSVNIRWELTMYSFYKAVLVHAVLGVRFVQLGCDVVVGLLCPANRFNI